ncbi:hypothetical protein F4604DRAFT_1092606 [Suillus subluteus]|nr:hypothetical protein F4604DRAFT_1092606 [Suillus subluteus]
MSILHIKLCMVACASSWRVVGVFMAQRAELEQDSLKVDVFIRRVCWKIVALADHIIYTVPCRDTPKIGALDREAIVHDRYGRTRIFWWWHLVRRSAGPAPRLEDRAIMGDQGDLSDAMQGRCGIGIL